MAKQSKWSIAYKLALLVFTVLAVVLTWLHLSRRVEFPYPELTLIGPLATLLMIGEALRSKASPKVKLVAVSFGILFGGLIVFSSCPRVDVERAAKARNVSALIRALRDRDAGVREDAAAALGKLGTDAKPAMPALIRALKAKNDTYWYEVRSAAATALGQIGPEAKQAVPALVETLKTGAGDSRYDKAHSAAATALGQIGPEAKDAVPALVEVLESDEFSAYHVREAAATALGQIGPAAKEAIPTLFDILEHRTLLESTHSAVSEALVKIDPAVSETIAARVEKLLEDLNSPNFSVRFDATRTLRRFGHLAFTPLMESLDSDDLLVRRRAAKALTWIGPDGQMAALPVLIEMLEDADPAIRLDAAILLSGIGPNAKKALPSLLEALNDRDTHVRIHAAWAVWKIDQLGDVAVPVLIAALKDQETSTSPAGCALDVRCFAARALGDIGPDAKRAAPTLMELLKDNSIDPRVRKAASQALKKIDARTAAEGGVE